MFKTFLGRKISTRYLVHWLQSGKVKQRTFDTPAEAVEFKKNKNLAWMVIEKIYTNGFYRVNVSDGGHAN